MGVGEAFPAARLGIKHGVQIFKIYLTGSATAPAIVQFTVGGTSTEIIIFSGAVCHGQARRLIGG
jgi:hypothetical protein